MEENINNVFWITVLVFCAATWFHSYYGLWLHMCFWSAPKRSQSCQILWLISLQSW